MSSNSVDDSKRLTVQTAKGTNVSTRPTVALPAGTSSVLNNAYGNHIHDNKFITNIKAGPSLDVLYERVAPHAILNAGGRADEVRCHPGTREEVISRIERWRMDAQDGVTPSRMFWLSGPAGAGKSAIMQTVAESWTSRDIHSANFFFFRTDTSRNHGNSLVSTLLYQIFDFYPTVREAVEKTITSKPRILDASIEEQFNQLISMSFRSIGPLVSHSIVLLIDGLDECDSGEKTSQRQILRALDTLVSQSDLPFFVLVASRVEHQITMAFNQVSSKVDSIFLDNEYLPHKDIHLFVTAEFGKIKTTHHLAHMLDADWPSASDVDRIVTMSSGQFIYAATVMRFILHSSASPTLSLQRVQGAAENLAKSPFSQLDALYTYVLSQAADQHALKDILHTQFCLTEIENLGAELSHVGEVGLQGVLSDYDRRYTHSSVIPSCIADLTTIARFAHGQLIFYHASLTDYFQDQSRSGEYFVDMDAFTVKFLPTLLARATQAGNNEHKFLVVHGFLKLLKTMTPDIMNALLRVTQDVLDNLGSIVAYSLLRNLFRLCVHDEDVENYKQLLHRYLVQYLSMPDVTLKSALVKLDDIPSCQRYLMMAQIELLYGDIAQDPDVVLDALCPESASDTDEIAMWVQNLLQCIHGEYYPYRLETYKRLMRQWIFWAVSNKVPLSNLHDIQNVPWGQMYITMAEIEHLNGDVSQDPDVVLDALRPESAFAAHEISLWIQNLLQRIRREYYPHQFETYKRLIGQWIFWAILNDIAIADLYNLPYGRWYFWQGTVAKWVTTYLNRSDRP